MAFVQRTTRPTEDSKYYKHTSAGGLNECLLLENGSTLPNCVGYTWGRAYEAMGSRPTLSRGNAEDWWRFNDGYPRGQEPRAGAIACWRKGIAGNNADGAGHVDFVEQVNANGSIITSDSGYKSPAYWWRTTRYRGSGNWGMGGDYVFQGFIYLPISGLPTPNSAGHTPHSAEAKPAKTVSGLPLLRYGSSGGSVKALQLLLSGYGYSAGKADGIFGKQTGNALAEFQQARGLTADRECGPITWAALLGL